MEGKILWINYQKKSAKKYILVGAGEMGWDAVANIGREQIAFVNDNFYDGFDDLSSLLGVVLGRFDSNGALCAN